MRNVRSKKVVQKEELEYETICDVCKKEFCPNNVGEHVSMESSWSIPCGEGSASVFDICPKCWDESIVPMMKEKFDAVPRETDW